jgi:general secretion pathway protein K
MGRQLWQRLGAPLHNERGAVLILTIFVVALVTILVLEYHYDAAVEIELAENYANDVRAYQLAMSGLQFAKAVLANDTNEYDAPNELWHNLETFGCIAPNDLLTIAKTFIESQLKLGEDHPEESPVSESAPQACVTLKIVDENRKLPINRILDTAEIETHWSGIATQLLRVLWDGEDSRDLPEDAIGAVMDWIDTGDGSTRAGGVSGENDYYQTLDPPYKTTGRKIEVPGELRLIRFFTCERLAKLFDGVECAQIPNMDLGTNLYFSTFDYDRININTAPPNLILAMTNNSETCLEEIETKRSPADDLSQLLAEPFKTTAEMNELICLKDPVTDLPELQTKVRAPNSPAIEPYSPDDLLGTSSTYFRVESQAVLDGQVNKKVVAVFYRNPGNVAGNPGDRQGGNQEDNQRDRQRDRQGGNQGEPQAINQGSQEDNQERLKLVYFKVE